MTQFILRENKRNQTRTEEIQKKNIKNTNQTRPDQTIKQTRESAVTFVRAATHMRERINTQTNIGEICLHTQKNSV